MNARRARQRRQERKRRHQERTRGAPSTTKELLAELRSARAQAELRVHQAYIEARNELEEKRTAQLEKINEHFKGKMRTIRETEAARRSGIAIATDERDVAEAADFVERIRKGTLPEIRRAD